MINFIILPNQLFDINYLKKENITNNKYKIFIYEHPQYFTKYNFNKKKLILHYSSIKYYKEYLENKNYKVEIIKYTDKFKIKDYEMFKSADNINLIPNKIYDNPNYLLNSP